MSNSQKELDDELKEASEKLKEVVAKLEEKRKLEDKKFEDS